MATGVFYLGIVPRKFPAIYWFGRVFFFAPITAHQSNELNPGVERKYGTFSPRKKRKVSKKCDQFTPNTLEMFSSMVLKCYLHR